MLIHRTVLRSLLALTVAILVSVPVLAAVPVRAADSVAPTAQRFTVDVGPVHTAMIAGNGTPWAVGSNASGRLCTGDTAARTVFTPMIGLPSGRRATQVRVERDRTFVLDDAGIVRGCGASLGSSLVIIPGIPSGRTVVDLATGLQHLVVLLDDGRVYGIGEGASGQLSGNVARTSFAEIAGLPASSRAIDVAAGDEFTVVLDERGAVYGTGFNGSGQLGNLPTFNNQLTELVAKPAGVEIVQVAAGGRHTLAVGSNGRVYGVGRNAEGQLATTAATGNEPNWVRLRGADDVVAADGGAFHSVVLTADGTPLTTGSNSSGTQGRPAGGENLELTEFQAHAFDYVAPAFAEIAAGGDSTVGRDRHGYLFGAGDNAANQLRSQDSADVEALRRMFPQVVRAVSGASISGAPLPGRTLTAGRGTWSPSVGLGYQYVWKRDGVMVQSGPGQTYEVVAADAGRSLTAEVYGFLTSHINDDVLRTPPVRVGAVNLARPTVRGTARVGLKLTGARGSWNAPGYTFSLQWIRGASPIQGATKVNYTLKKADRGKSITLRVTARRVGFPTISAASAAIRVSKLVK